jgi:hypothetical protein
MTEAFSDIQGMGLEDGGAVFRLGGNGTLAEFAVTREGLQSLLGAILQIGIASFPEHDGFRVGQFPDGRLALEYRFGQGRWLPIRLGPDDLESLRISLLDDPRFRPAT